MRNQGAAGEGTSCTTHLVSAGLPYRTEVLLERERRTFPSMVASLFTPGKGEITPPPLTAEVLKQALMSKEPGRRYTAAFLIGRCRARDATVDEALTRCLEDIIEETPGTDVAIEAAMSLALRGKVERGRQALRALLASPRLQGDHYKAAFYLAQMGDPSGYETLVKTLRSEIPHYRLMALRHAIAFVPYEGRRIDGADVDVRKLLIERLTDPDDVLRSEVPFYLEELQILDLRKLLEPLERHDPSPLVRTAARIVLDRIR
jgi:HEAT repeat protein